MATGTIIVNCVMPAGQLIRAERFNYKVLFYVELLCVSLHRGWVVIYSRSVSGRWSANGHCTPEMKEAVRCQRGRREKLFRPQRHSCDSHIHCSDGRDVRRFKEGEMSPARLL